MSSNVPSALGNQPSSMDKESRQGQMDQREVDSSAVCNESSLMSEVFEEVRSAPRVRTLLRSNAAEQP